MIFYFLEIYCGGNLILMIGNIILLNYFDFYFKGIECIWYIKCLEGWGLFMFILNILLLLIKDCLDYLIMCENVSFFFRIIYYVCEFYVNLVLFILRSKDFYIKLILKSSNVMVVGFKIFYVIFEGKLFLFWYIIWGWYIFLCRKVEI